MAKPLIFHSKLLCLSFLYLSTTLPFSIYLSLSGAKPGCLFQSSLPEILSVSRPPLFSYPSSYGEHKYALPAAQATCSSPLLFSDYGAAVEEIDKLSRGESNSPPVVLKYMNRKRETFAGSLSTTQRLSFFNHSNESMEISCGFFKQFPITDSDRLAMEKCHGVVVVSAIFGDHDKIRQPKGLGTKTLESACFFMFIDELTLKGLHAHNILIGSGGSEASKQPPPTIGVWKIVRLLSSDMPYKNPAMNGVIPKHLVHRIFPNAKFSIWIDAKLQLTVDPLLLVHSLVVSKNAEMAISKHPFNKHTMEEAMATARWKKWPDVESLRVQMETYCQNGLQPWSPSKLPYTTDVPDTALIIRRHGLGSNLFSCLLFNELEAFNPRDQLPFAYVRDLMFPRLKMHMFDVEVFEHIAVEYRHNLRRVEPDQEDQSNGTTRAPAVRMALLQDVEGSSCRRYLLKMWGEEV